jgi:anti-anti-sigma factor
MIPYSFKMRTTSTANPAEPTSLGLGESPMNFPVLTDAVCFESAPAVSAGIAELVRGKEKDLLERLMPLVRRQSVLLDLEPVARIDAAGLAALVTLHCEACKSGHSFAVSNPARHVREILELVGLDRVLVIQLEREPCFAGAA